MAQFPPFRGGERVLVVAHRGASRAARENSLEAFRLARELGADGVELDVRRTRDGALVVHHDPALAGLGLLVDHRLDEVRAAAPWLPTLVEALDACAGMWVNVEIKNLPFEPDWDPEERLARAVGEVVTAAGLGAAVLASSFNPGALEGVRAVAPEVATGLLVPRGVDPLAAADAAAAGGHAALHPEAGLLAGEMATRVVARAGEHGVAVVPWTVDDPGEMVRLAEAGVAALITNRPDLARHVLPPSPSPPSAGRPSAGPPSRS